VNHATALELISDSDVATAGFFQLKWTGTSPHYKLQESLTHDFTSFKTLYSGSDLATVLSGKPDGDYYYRVVATSKQNVHSNIVKVSVAHHPLINAFLFFIAGAIVFIATLVLIIKGNRQQTV